MFKFLLIYSLVSLFTNILYAEKITIAAASDLKYALDEIVQSFLKSHSKDQVEVIYGSSGKLSTQIQQDAPYDMFFSADISYPQELAKKGYASSAVKLYGVGRIVLWSATKDASKMTLEDLKKPDIKHIAIANPKHAPYGKRAQEALEAKKLWDVVKEKLVYGENIVQTAQFVESGNAEIGIIALSLALSPELSKKGAYFLIPNQLHQPLEQGYVITKRAANNPFAKTFAEFFETKPIREIMNKYGFKIDDKKEQPVSDKVKK